MILIHCDGGCGKQTKEVKEFHEMGRIRTRHYCDDCKQSVMEFERDLDEIHTEVADVFSQKQDALRYAWLGKHPEGTLPDIEVVQNDA